MTIVQKVPYMTATDV